MYKILVVDGKPPFIDLMKFILQSNGYSVQGARNCTIAKDLTERWKPNLIILDSNINGKNALRFIETIQISPSLPILLLTAKDSYFNALECLTAGASDYVSKPVSISELLAKVNAFENGLVMPRYQYLITQSIQTNSIVEERRDRPTLALGDIVSQTLR